MKIGSSTTKDGGASQVRSGDSSAYRLPEVPILHDPFFSAIQIPQRTYDPKAWHMSGVEVRRSSSLHRSDSFATANSRQPPEVCHYIPLPAELHYSIISHLEYQELRNLRNTCRFFRDYVSPLTLQEAKQEWKTKLYDDDIAGKFAGGNRRPCYACVRVRRDDKFPSSSIWATSRAGGRMCIDCCWSSRKRGEPIFITGRPWSKCRWCRRQKMAWCYVEGKPCTCNVCGRIQLVAFRLPLYLFPLAEAAVPICATVYSFICWRNGWIVTCPGHDTGDDQWDAVHDIMKGAVPIMIIQQLFNAANLVFWLIAWRGLLSVSAVVTTLYAVYTAAWVVEPGDEFELNNYDLVVLHHLLKSAGALCVTTAVLRCCWLLVPAERKPG